MSFGRIKSLAVFVWLLIFADASFASQVVASFSRGSYQSTGVFGTGGSGEPGGNYLTGNRGLEYRSFFAFSLAGVSGTITGATLQLGEPDSTFTYASPFSSNSFTVFDVSTSITALSGNTGGAAAFDDLGSGVGFGDASIAAKDLGTNVNIALNAAALVAINAAIGGEIAFGGAITNLGLDGEWQFVFGASGAFQPYYPHDTVLLLDVSSAVPEMSSLFMLSFALVGFGLLFRRRQAH